MSNHDKLKGLRIPQGATHYDRTTRQPFFFMANDCLITAIWSSDSREWQRRSCGLHNHIVEIPPEYLPGSKGDQAQRELDAILAEQDELIENIVAIGDKYATECASSVINLLQCDPDARMSCSFAAYKIIADVRFDLVNRVEIREDVDILKREPVRMNAAHCFSCGDYRNFNKEKKC